MPARANTPSRFLIGRVSRPHGITGELKIQLEKEYADAHFHRRPGRGVF